MDATLGLSILGIIITIALGVWSIYLAIRNRYPGRITFAEDIYLALINSLTKTLPELAISYKGLPVEKNLFLFKGRFLNDGKKDITPEMVETPLCAKLPEGYKWLAANAVPELSNMRVTVEIKEDQQIEIKLGLFRRGESFSLEALIEGGTEKRPTAPITFYHRIADTGNVYKISTKKPPAANSVTIRMAYAIGIFLIGLAIISTPSIMPSPYMLLIVRGSLLGAALFMIFGVGLIEGRWRKRVRRLLDHQ